jgi:CDP-glycerol glycerophosphotransferase (TagB/SpsB family)
VQAFARASQNFIIDESSSYVEAFHAADGLISDASSLLYEFMLLDKPMLYLHCEEGAGLNEAGLLMTQAIATARGPADIARFVDEVARGADTRRVARNAAILKLVGPNDGCAGLRVKQMVDAELP